MPEVSPRRLGSPPFVLVGLGTAVLLAMAVAPARGDSHDSRPQVSLYKEALLFVDDAGTNVELSSFEGRQVILTMFYTRCRSTCPATLEKVRQIDKAFAERGRPVEILLVSYDSTDDARRLARYRKEDKLPSAWHLLSGRPEAVERLARRIGLGRYLNMGDHIFHSYRIVLPDEAGVVRKALDPEHDKVLSLFEVPVGDVRAPATHP